jgi:hypothetical protein
MIHLTRIPRIMPMTARVPSQLQASKLVLEL